MYKLLTKLYLKMPLTLKIVENGVQEEQGKCIFPEIRSI
jgi:hypothetical protein